MLWSYFIDSTDNNWTHLQSHNLSQSPISKYAPLSPHFPFFTSWHRHCNRWTRATHGCPIPVLWHLCSQVFRGRWWVACHPGQGNVCTLLYFNYFTWFVVPSDQIDRCTAIININYYHPIPRYLPLSHPLSSLLHSLLSGLSCHRNSRITSRRYPLFSSLRPFVLSSTYPLPSPLLSPLSGLSSHGDGRITSRRYRWLESLSVGGSGSRGPTATGQRSVDTNDTGGGSYQGRRELKVWHCDNDHRSLTTTEILSLTLVIALRHTCIF